MPTSAERRQRNAAPLGSLVTRVVRRNGVGNDNVLTISGRHGLVSQAEYFNKRVASAALDGYYLIHRGEYAYNKSHSTGYPMGAIKRLDRYDAGVVSPLYICFGVTRPDVVDSDYLAHYFEGGMLEDQLRGVAAQGARDHGLLNVKPVDFLGLSVELPPLPEQRKIAAILSSVDDTLEKTEAVIAQLQVVKKAMMHELLTRGMPGRHTRFKQTEIGEIPEAWEVRPIGSLGVVAYGLTVNQQRRDAATQAPYLTVANLQADGFVLDTVKNIGVLPGDPERFGCKSGDVLMVEGNANIERLGRAAVWRDEIPGAMHQNHLIRARLDGRIVKPEWLVHFLHAESGRAQIEAHAKTSSGLNTINSTVVSEIRVAIPSLDEQSLIGEVASSLEHRLRVETTARDALRRLKENLSSALLSGDLRVTTTEPPP